METVFHHVPIMVEDVLRLLEPARGGIFVDGTLGGGGHAEAVLSALPEGGRLYGIDPDDYDGFLLYYPSTNMGAEELLLLKLADDSQREDAAAALEARLAAQKTGFDGYGAEQTALLADSVLEVRGNYLLFCVAENADEVRRAFLAAL